MNLSCIISVSVSIISKMFFFKKLVQFLFPVFIYNIIKIIYRFLFNIHGGRNYVKNKIHLFFFIFSNNIKHFKKVLPNDFKSKFSDNFETASELQTPLLKVKQLINCVNKTEEYNFIDIGSGYGILLLYVYKNFNFKSYTGLEFVDSFVEKSKINLKRYKKITLVHDTAEKYLLSDKRNVIYLANPFDETILKKFIKNNLSNIKKNSSIILYHRNKHKDILSSFGLYNKDIDRGLSVHYFKK